MRLVRAQIDHAPATGAGTIGVDHVADLEVLPLVDVVVGAVDVETEQVLQAVDV